MRGRSLILVGLVAVVVVAVTGVAFAYFTATGSGTGAATVGTLAITKADNGGYTVNFTGQYPGASQSGNITITNSGNVPTTSVTLAIGTPVDTACSVCPAGVGTSTDLSGEATLTVVDTTTHTTVINGVTIDVAHGHGSYTINGTGGIGLWAVGEAHTFTVTVAVPTGADNTYQGTATGFTATFSELDT